MKTKLEIWTIKKDWSILKIHKSFKDADEFKHPEAFKTLYRQNDGPIFIYQNF